MVLIYLSVRQTLYFIRASTITPPPPPQKKKCIQFYQKPLRVSGFTSRLSKENKRKKENWYTLAEPCYYSLSHSRSFRNCRVALLLCLFAMELMVFFCLFWLFFFNVIFRFHFVYYHSNMHACTFFFLLEERLVIHPPIHSFVAYSLYHLPTFLSNLQTGLE